MSEEQTQTQTHVVAERDWHMRARVRIRENVASESQDPRGTRHFRAGEECVMIQWGRRDYPITRDSWWDSMDLDGAYIIPARLVEVIAILDEVPPQTAQMSAQRRRQPRTRRTRHENAYAPIMIAPGMFTDERVISGIRVHEPNRYGGEEDDLIGWASINGKRTRICTSFWGGAPIWQVEIDSE